MTIVWHKRVFGKLQMSYLSANNTSFSWMIEVSFLGTACVAALSCGGVRTSSVSKPVADSSITCCKRHHLVPDSGWKCAKFASLGREPWFQNRWTLTIVLIVSKSGMLHEQLIWYDETQNWECYHQAKRNAREVFWPCETFKSLFRAFSHSRTRVNDGNWNLRQLETCMEMRLGSSWRGFLSKSWNGCKKVLLSTWLAQNLFFEHSSSVGEILWALEGEIMDVRSALIRRDDETQALPKILCPLLFYLSPKVKFPPQARDCTSMSCRYLPKGFFPFNLDSQDATASFDKTSPRRRKSNKTYSCQAGSSTDNIYVVDFVHETCSLLCSLSE